MEMPGEGEERKREEKGRRWKTGRGGGRRERGREWKTTPRTTAPLESTPTFSRDSVGAFGWLFPVKVRGRSNLFAAPG